MSKDERTINVQQDHEIQTVMDAKKVSRKSVLIAISKVGNARECVYTWLDNNKNRVVSVVID